ncbi:Sodium- and chloride-dependent GABA transporter 1 [Toxocara canis]|uniref:Transporter n=1 Tax=Toxocara canis TaxID=6265 RepID=A0A0B2VIL9_TOXCA|nr:Sodium- and chloride-dependent GABA transporter 1 [Toxocara canis]
MAKLKRTSVEETEGSEENSEEGFSEAEASKETFPSSADPKKVNRKSSILGVEAIDRGQWSGRFDFLMSMIAYAVGLGNVWRFPYLCFKNGGGSFLVVYAIFFCLGAVPVFIMEVTIGQYLQRGAMEMWNMCPLFKGVGIGNVVIAFMCIAYFCVIVSWAIFYMINSLKSTFPWETCDNWWNTAQCITGKENTTTLMKAAVNLTLTERRTETSVEQFWEYVDFVRFTFKFKFIVKFAFIRK